VRVPEEPPTFPVSAPQVEDGSPVPNVAVVPRPEPATAIAKDEHVAGEEVQSRHAAGEFDDAIEAFETLPYDEYKKFVGHAIRHLDDNRYYVSLDGELYVYVDGRDPEHRHFLCRLSRSSS
jgi:hypothetical protein